MVRIKKTASGGVDSDSIAARLAAHLQKQFNDSRAAVVLGGDISSEVTDWISTQSLAIDVSIGMPGIPVGRVTNIVGAVSCGKTTVCWHILAECQQRGGVAILIDAERALSRQRAITLGIDPDTLLVCQPDTLEEAIDTIQECVKQIRSEPELRDKLVCIVLDSVASLATKYEDENETGQASIGGHAKVMGKALRKIVKSIADQRIALVLVNQWRTSIGMFVPPHTQIAEAAIEYASSVRMEITRTSKEIDPKDKNISYGIMARSVCAKNKCAIPFHYAEYRIGWECGLDLVADLLNIAVAQKIVEKSAGWYTYNGGAKFRESHWRDILEANPHLQGDIVATTGLVYPEYSKIGEPIDFSTLARRQDV